MSDKSCRVIGRVHVSVAVADKTSWLLVADLDIAYAGSLIWRFILQTLEHSCIDARLVVRIRHVQVFARVLSARFL